MNKDDDEALADVIIRVCDMETGLKKFFSDFERRMMQAERRAEKADRRNELCIKRLVKLESRAEEFDRKLELSIANLVLVGQKLEKSIKDQEESSRRQTEINEYFLNQIRKNGHK